MRISISAVLPLTRRTALVGDSLYKANEESFEKNVALVLTLSNIWCGQYFVVKLLFTRFRRVTSEREGGSIQMVQHIFHIKNKHFCYYCNEKNDIKKVPTYMDEWQSKYT